MAEESEEKIKIELEIPKEGVRIGSVSSETEGSAEGQKEKAEKTAKKKTQEAEEEEAGASYEPAEIAKAPLEPPEPKDKKPPNSRQKLLIAGGFILVLISIILWPLFNFALFISVAVVGAIIIAFGTLVRV